MGKIYAVANQKGGVGKSTTVVNLAAYLGSRGERVLCIDIDAQGNCTTGLGIKKKTVEYSSYDVLIGQVRIQDAILRTNFKNISVIPATSSLAGGEIEMIEIDDRMNRLKMQLLTCRLDYDYVFIDCPPSLSLMTINGLVACDKVIVPMQAEFFALEGLTQLLDTIKIIKTKYNPSLDIEGILFTMFDPRLNLSGQVVEEVEKHLPGKVFSTKIPRNVRLSEAPSYGQPVMYYDKNSKGAESYELLGLEILNEQAPVKTEKKGLFKRKK
ncbi:MAG: ParA family protein [Oscillospiraceae bacterium]|nr:ParA family protein [Oscillospiraceae bacterium]